MESIAALNNKQLWDNLPLHVFCFCAISQSGKGGEKSAVEDGVNVESFVISSEAA